jgi:hypothetical protein
MGRVLQTLSEFLEEERLPQRNEEDESGADSTHLYNLIKDNEIDHLRETLACHQPYYQSLAKLRWSDKDSQ